MKAILFIFSYLFLMNQLSAQKLKIDEPLRYLALGDSYTIGQSVEENERWPVRLVEELKSIYGIQDAELDIIAKTGWTTA